MTSPTFHSVPVGGAVIVAVGGPLLPTVIVTESVPTVGAETRTRQSPSWRSAPSPSAPSPSVMAGVRP
jgi:hypothetical protein